MATIPSPIVGLPASGPATFTGALTVSGLLTTQAGISNTGGPSITASTLITTTGAQSVQASGNLISQVGSLDIQTAGGGLKVAEGSNAKQGTATLVAGTVTVANTSVTANSRIFLTGQLLGGTAGGLNVTSRVVGTSFTVTSTNAADTSTFAYEIFEPG